MLKLSLIKLFSFNGETFLFGWVLEWPKPFHKFILGIMVINCKTGLYYFMGLRGFFIYFTVAENSVCHI